jgi:hypothetical protein
MKKFMICLVAVVGFVAFLSSPAVSQELSKQENEVWTAVENYWAKWAEGDLETFKSGIHDKYLGWSNERPIPADKAQVLKWYAGMKEYGKVEWMDLQLAKISVIDDIAIVHYYFNMSLVWGKDDKKKTEKIEGKNTEFYLKKGNLWVLVGDHTFVEEDDD